MTHWYAWQDQFLRTGWRRPIGCLELQLMFRKRASNYRALLRKMTCKDKASYGSSPPCRTWVIHAYDLNHSYVWRDLLCEITHVTNSCICLTSWEFVLFGLNNDCMCGMAHQYDDGHMTHPSLMNISICYEYKWHYSSASPPCICGHSTG